MKAPWVWDYLTTALFLSNSAQIATIEREKTRTFNDRVIWARRDPASSRHTPEQQRSDYGNDRDSANDASNNRTHIA